jgi:hypothetical protein
MNDEPNGETLLEAMDALGMSSEEAAARMDAPLDLIEDVCAGKIRWWSIPYEYQFVADTIIAEAGLNGARIDAVEMDDPIELPKDDSAKAEANTGDAASPRAASD